MEDILHNEYENNELPTATNEELVGYNRQQDFNQRRKKNQQQLSDLKNLMRQSMNVDSNENIQTNSATQQSTLMNQDSDNDNYLTTSNNQYIPTKRAYEQIDPNHVNITHDDQPPMKRRKFNLLKQLYLLLLNELYDLES